MICGRVFGDWLVQEGLKRLFLPMRVGLRVAAGAVLGFRLLSVPWSESEEVFDLA